MYSLCLPPLLRTFDRPAALLRRDGYLSSTNFAREAWMDGESITFWVLD